MSRGKKGHPDILQHASQILDDGFLTDSVGRKINFQNTIIIMTSNMGVKQINDFGIGVGFETKSSLDQSLKLSKRLYENFKKYLSPEFLNRIDDCVIFNSLSIKILIRL